MKITYKYQDKARFWLCVSVIFMMLSIGLAYLAVLCSRPIECDHVSYPTTGKAVCEITLR